MPSPKLDKEEFERRYRSAFSDPAFSALASEIARLTDVAWDAYEHSRKAPRTHPAGPAFADPTYELSDDWRATSDAIAAAERRQKDPASPSRVLLINGAARSEHTCPGEISKTFRLAEIAREIFEDCDGLEVEFLDLSRLTSEYGRIIYPCKTCVSTAMPLCHWPCSCYPNYALGQVHDWMADIYPMWVAAHGIMILTPVNWYGPSSVLKLMIDRLVCADGGNPDPTTTHGKDAEAAKKLELDGWSYPRHLAGRVFSIVVHGDAAGAEQLEDALSDWLSDMALVPAGRKSALARYIGYLEPYATSHAALDKDEAVQEEVANAARALIGAVTLMRSDGLPQPDAGLDDPRPK